MMPSSASHAALRATLAVIIVVDLVSFVFFLEEGRDIGIANNALNAFNEPVSRPLVRGVVVGIGVAAAIAFTRRPGRIWHGALALASLAVLSTAHAQLFGSPWRHLFYSGLCLLGWLLGLAITRTRGSPADESYARIGSIALLASAYLSAGISKTVFAGFDWLSGIPIQAAIVAQDGMVAGGIASLYRLWVVETPAVARALSVLTEAFELAAPLMLFGRIPRLVVSLGLVAFHVNIFILTPILYWEPVVFLLTFGLSADDPEPATERSDSRAFAAAVALLVVCAVLAIGYQSRRYTQVVAAQGVSPPADLLGPPPPPPAGSAAAP